MKQGRIVILAVVGAIVGTIWSSSVKRVQVMEVSGPKRYLDQIFDSALKTAGIKYTTAPAYKTKIATDILLDVYQPVGDSRENRPALILIHGGGFATGNRGIYDEEKNGGLFGWGKYFAERGYVVFSVDYRLGERMLKLDDPELVNVVNMATSDVLTSVRWVRQNADKYKVDPDKIAVGGNSAGAVLALYAGYRSTATEKISAVISLSGTLGMDDLDLIGAGSPPAMMLAGTEDSTVPYAWSLAVKDKLKAVGVRVDWYSYPGVGHEVAGYRQVSPQVAQFLYEVMRLDQVKVVISEAVGQTSPVPSPVPSLIPSPSPSPIPSVSSSVEPSATPTPSPSVSPSPSPSVKPKAKPVSMSKPTPSPSLTPEIVLTRLPPEDFVWHPGPVATPIVEKSNEEVAPKLSILELIWEKLSYLLKLATRRL